MTSLTMTQLGLQNRPPDDRIHVKVEPSRLVGEGLTGIYVQVNDHHTLKDPENKLPARELIGRLEEGFEGSLRRAEQIIDHIMSLQ